MLPFIKRYFYYRANIFIEINGRNLLSAAPPSCISMNNQEGRVRSQTVNVYSEEPFLYFFLLVLK